MNSEIKNPKLSARIARCARIIDRSERFLRLALLSHEETNLILREREAEEEADRIAEPESKEASSWDPDDDDDDVMADTLRTDEEGGTLLLTEDDGVGPVGPRAEKNKSRYHISPGHGECLSDLLQSTASVKASAGILKLLNG